MSDDHAKTPRTLLIADHLWDALATMAAEMGTDREALVNQALFTFARLNGFLLPADLLRLSTLPRSALTDSGRLRIAPPPPVSAAPPVEVSEASPVEVDQALLADEVAATSMELPGIAAPYESPQPRPGDDDAPDAPEGRTLVLMSDGREPDRVVKERYLIGRGKHCDLVINSGKVSREHAAIIREGAAWYIEDLGSSNGTWFEKRRISRRQIQEGDEYYICSEKLSCSFR